jgi:hypothetical protein
MSSTMGDCISNRVSFNIEFGAFPLVMAMFGKISHKENCDHYNTIYLGNLGNETMNSKEHIYTLTR